MGTEAFWIPAVMAGLSAAASGVNKMQADKRESNAETTAILNQEQYRDKARGDVKALTDQIAKNTPQQIQGKETGDFVNTLRRNQASNPSGSALAPVAGASARYNADKTAGTGATQDYGNTQAGEMSAIDSAIRQRQNEGLAMQTLGTNLNTNNLNSQGAGFVDQLRAKAAGVANPWVNLASGLLSGAATAYSKNPDMFSGGTPQYKYGQTVNTVSDPNAYAGGLS